MTDPEDVQQPDDVSEPTPVARRDVLGEPVGYDSTEAADHWNDAIWQR